MKEDTRDTYFKLRLTKEEKQKLKEYAEVRSITMSEAIRELCYQIFN